MTPHQAQDILKALASDGSKIFFTRHAEQRMIERQITRTQVLRCLASGYFEEQPARSPQGSWVMRVRNYTAGEYVSVAVALDENDSGDYAIVITVIK